MPEPQQHKDDHELTLSSLMTVFGGGKGLFDSSVPVGVFVLVRFFAPLNIEILAAIVAGLLIVALRKARGESLQQAFGGFFGLLLAVLIVRSTGSGKGIFWSGIAITAGSGVLMLISLLARRPAVAMLLSAIDPRYGAWRTHEPLRRAVFVSTFVWMVSFFIRAAVATTVLLAVGDKDRDSLVVYVVINAVKWPLIVGSALLTVALVKRAEVPPVPTEAQSS